MKEFLTTYPNCTVTQKFESLLYISQMIQAEGIRYGVGILETDLWKMYGDNLLAAE